MSYIPFGLSEPSLVPIPPAKRTALTLPARIASRPSDLKCSFEALISVSVIAFIGVITPLLSSALPFITLEVTEKSVSSICLKRASFCESFNSS